MLPENVCKCEHGVRRLLQLPLDIVSTEIQLDDDYTTTYVTIVGLLCAGCCTTA